MPTACIEQCACCWALRLVPSCHWVVGSAETRVWVWWHTQHSASAGRVRVWWHTQHSTSASRVWAWWHTQHSPSAGRVSHQEGSTACSCAVDARLPVQCSSAGAQAWRTCCEVLGNQSQPRSAALLAPLWAAAAVMLKNMLGSVRQTRVCHTHQP